MTIAVAPDRALLQTMAERLHEARARTFLLVAPLSDEELHAQHDPLMSPILWDLGHIAHFEELWLTRNLDGPIEFVEMPGMYNPFEHPRSERGALPLPGLDECREIMDEIRGRVLGPYRGHRPRRRQPAPPRWVRLPDGSAARVPAQRDDSPDPPAQAGAPYSPRGRASTSHQRPPRCPRRATWRAFRRPGRNRHRRPVGGIRQRAAAPRGGGPAVLHRRPPGHQRRLPRLHRGRRLRQAGVLVRGRPPLAGRVGRPGAEILVPRRGPLDDAGHGPAGPVDPRHPVCHVSWYEAEAFARFAGKRLPTEMEWEAAASWDPATGRKRRFPWGDEPASRALANLDQLGFGTAPVGAYQRNVSPIGCYGMIGDVWEWTASDFRPWPGFEAFPYQEYSEVFFGDEYKVLRGGSWATRPGAVRNTFRNWDYPIRRQIFSGFRCARDA